LAACKLKQNANEGCNTCASLAGLVLSFIVCFIVCFILLVIAPLTLDETVNNELRRGGGADSLLTIFGKFSVNLLTFP